MKHRHFSAKLIFPVFFLALMFVLGASSVWKYVASHMMKSFSPDVNYRELYPFEEDSDALAGNVSASSGDRNLLDRYLDAADYFVNGVETITTKKNPWYTSLQSIPSVLDEVSGLCFYQSGSFVRLENGHFTYVFGYSRSQESLDNIQDFSDWLKDRDIPLLTIIAANKSDDSITEFPEFIQHGYAQTVMENKLFYDENSIDYMDAKEILLSHDSDFYAWFYRTDHHWNVHAGRLIAEETAKALNEKYGLPTDAAAVSEGLFELTVYPDSFLGSMGTIAGTLYLEDMEVYYPVDESCFHVEVPDLGIDKTGSFEETLIDQSYLTGRTDYSAFMYGDRALIRIENMNCNNGTRVLIIKKSFANVVTPYLACAVQYLDIVDPRTFDGSIRSLVEQTNPDAVLTCVSAVNEDSEAFWSLK